MENQLMLRRSRAEQSVLGGLMLDNSRWQEVHPMLSAIDFHNNQHKLIFEAIKKQLQHGQPADVVTIADVMGLDLAYIATLAKDTPSAANILAYAKIIKDEAERGKTAGTLRHALDTIRNGGNPGQVLQQVIEHAELATINKKEGVMFIGIEEVRINPINWLIDDFVEHDALVEVFGAPESGKSLLAIDWGLCIAAGIPWRGHNTQQGSVFYVAGEGHNGLSRRFGAWGCTNGVNINTLQFFPSNGAAALFTKHGAIDLERAINRTLSNKAIMPPRLIIVDTLARNFGGGNENSTEDMSLFIAHIDQHLRDKFNCTVLLVHHTGHGAAERGRGSSALKAAVDTEYSLTKNQAGIINLSCTKMKDASHPAPKSFTISSVNLGVTDEKGHEANGAVLTETTYTPPEPKEKPLGKNQKAALETLERLYDEFRLNFENEGKNPDDVKVTEKVWQEKSGIDRFRMREIKKSLQEADLISVVDGFVYLI